VICFLFFSFQSDCQMVIDAAVTVTRTRVSEVEAERIARQEALYPSRHKLTLPLNGLNNIFQNCEIAFNYHTKLDCDR
jgi:hypothetical protein